MTDGMRRIAFFNEKGGTGKTTLCVHAAALLAAHGARVLVVDLDTQGHAGKSLGVDVRGMSPTVHEWLLDDAAAPFEAVVRPTPVAGVELVPGNKALAELPVALAAAADRADRLDRRLASLPDGYDYVLLDAPPSQSLVTENVLRAARELVVPVALTYLALDGCAEVVQSLERVRAERGSAPALALVVPTFHRPTQLAREILERLRARFPRELARTALRFCVKVDEAQSHGQTVFEYAPRSAGARELRRVCEELRQRG